MAEMALLQIVDKCTNCKACMAACERNWGLLPSTTSSFNNTTRQFTDAGTADRMQADDFLVIKEQSTSDVGPFVRYSCWHCPDPPCMAACDSTGLRAISKDSNGAVWIDWTRCFPNVCKAFGAGRARPCVADCGRGGYIKVGVGRSAEPADKAYKCQLCHDRLVTVLSDDGSPGGATKQVTACTAACPRKAMVYDTMANIQTNYLNGQYVFTAGLGNMYWVGGPASEYITKWSDAEFRRRYAFTPPTADPFVDDHISPLFERVLLSPAAKLLAVPTLLVGGLYAMYRRRLELESESA